MAITRTAWIDDDGTGTTGTVINNAEKTLLYDQIDAALAGYLPTPGGYITSDLRWSPDGTYDLGKVGANRPRDGFFSRDLTISGQLAAAGRVQISADATFAYVTFNNSVSTTLGVMMRVDFTGGNIYHHIPTGGAFYWRINNVARLQIDPLGKIQISGHPSTVQSFAAGDKYLLVDASGNLHVSALGPAS